MSNVTTIYSRCITSFQFDYNDSVIVLHGMNKHGFNFKEGTFHADPSKDGVPFANPNIPVEAWTYFKNKFANRPAFFNKSNGDLFFEASTDKDAVSKLKDSKTIIDDSFLISKQKGIKQIVKNSKDDVDE